jgi:hypothetical protein
MKLADKTYSILCDDVRPEIGGKQSLMGVYGNTIIVSRLPTLLPKLCLALCFEGLRKNIPDGEVKMINPGVEPVAFPLQSLKNQKVGETAFIFITFSPYVIKSIGEARFEVRFGGEAKPSIVHNVKIEVAKKSEKGADKKTSGVAPQKTEKKPKK